MCFGRGPSNHQGRRGEGGDPGVKSKGWGAFLMGRSHGFLGLPAKKLGHVAGGARSLYMRASTSPEGEPSAFWSGAPPTAKEDGGRGEIQA